MRKFLIIISKTLILLFFIAVFAVVSVIGWAALNPERAVSMAVEHFLPADTTVTWNKLDIDLDHISGLNFIFKMEVDGLHIKKTSPSMDLPVAHMAIDVSVFLREAKPKVFVHRLIVAAPNEILYQPEATKKEEPQQTPFQTIQNVLSFYTKFQDTVQLQILDVAVEKLTLQSETGTAVNLKLLATKNGAEDKDLAFKSEVQTNGKSPFTATVEGVIRQEKALNALLQGQIGFEGFGVKLKNDFRMECNNESVKGFFSGPVTYKKKKTSLAAQLKAELSMNESGADFKASARIKGINKKFLKIENAWLRLNSPFSKGILVSEKPTDFEIEVPLKIIYGNKKMNRSLAKACECELPQIIKARLGGEVWLTSLLSDSWDRQKLLTAALKLEEVDNSFVTINGAATVQIDKKNDKYLLYPVIDTIAKVHRFKALRILLDSMGVIIPAPLDILDGVLELVMKGPVNNSSERFLFPATLAVDLKSESQKVQLDSRATMALTSDFRSGDLDVLAVIRALRLDLPPLEPTKGKPRVLPDRRILAAEKPKKPSDFKLTVSVAVQTEEAGAVKLSHRYFEPYLPLTLNLKNEDKKNTGSLSLEPFAVNYLRRTVHIQSMKVTLPSVKTNPMVVDGRLMIKQTQYTVFVDINGPANKPRVTFSSEPYLSQNEIISVLLYDRTSDELISTDVETAGNVQAAVADRAIGIFGIWVFASTPIRSFSYNPVSKIYTATVALADDVTASVGTNWEEATELALRKRISNRWILSAAWMPSGDNGEEESTIVLQWENRF